MCTEHHDTETHHDEATKQMLHRRRIVQGVAAGGFLSMTTPALTGCATNAETGSKQLLLVGDNQLSEMAASSWAETKQKTPQSRDPRYTRRLENVGARIARGANKSNESWDYEVFDEDTKNAFVLPGNRVGFYKGMMDFTDNDDQVAAIMGHEVGHVTGRHAAARMTKQMAGQTAISVGTMVASSQLRKRCQTTSRTQLEYNNCTRSANRNTQMLNAALGIGFTVGVILPFSRKHELQSDLLGAKYMHKAGYNPYQAVKLWEKMAENSPSRQPAWLSTHPDPNLRARNLHSYIKYQEQLGSQGWESIKMPKI